jgi:hypothetical protein
VKAKRGIAFSLGGNWAAIPGLEKNCPGFTMPMRLSVFWTAALTSTSSAVRAANDSAKFWNEKERIA